MARLMGFDKLSPHMRPKPVKGHGRWASTKGTADGLPQTQPAHVT
jgi:hypothetical protein